MQNETQIYIPPAQEEYTLRSVFKKKILKWIEKRSARSIFLSFLEFLLILALLITIVSPKTSYAIFSWLVTSGDFILVKSISVFVLVRSRKTIFRKIRYHRKKKEISFEGIPVSELATFLIEKQSFKFKEATKSFHIHQRIFEKIAKALESMKILERGKDNARVLTSDFLESREDLIKMLKEGSRFTIHRFS